MAQNVVLHPLSALYYRIDGNFTKLYAYYAPGTGKAAMACIEDILALLFKFRFLECFATRDYMQSMKDTTTATDSALITSAADKWSSIRSAVLSNETWARLRACKCEAGDSKGKSKSRDACLDDLQVCFTEVDKQLNPAV